MIDKNTYQYWQQQNFWLLKTNVNAMNKQMNHCYKEISMFRRDKNE